MEAGNEGEGLVVIYILVHWLLQAYGCSSIHEQRCTGDYEASAPLRPSPQRTHCILPYPTP